MEKIEDIIKYSKQKLGEKIPCSIEVLTPVHIGSGVKLAKDIDFIKNPNSVHIVSQAELLEYLQNNPDEMQRFIDGDYKLKALNRIPTGRTFNISMGNSKEINEFERNGFGKPYIPGSSLKGSLRTILLKKRFSSLSEEKRNEILSRVTNTKKEWASEPVLKEIFGDTSNENLMRALEIFDAEFEEVDLIKVLILSLTNEEGTSYGWKQMGRPPKNIDNPKYATSIFVEALPIGAKGYSSITLSNFLFNDPTAKETLNFSEPSLSDIEEFTKTINSFSLEKLNKEEAFFQNLNSSNKLNGLISSINTLSNQINQLQKDEMILRISLGSGWKGMTGDYLEQSWLSTFRSKYRMGKNNFPVFPKTRRIVFEDDEPKYLTGWIKIKLNETKPAESSKKSDNSVQTEMNPFEALKQKFRVTEFKKK
ncbi:type III-A CRISPR-associated RAMP protein Csm5 [Ignavibacterium sp.]|uniref:type III-A CRISPR-associated RAMP protein Csm5 n=1 Tax=Ignavibacterium sp. TaxID=2651167 RepID=UPI00307D7632